ncbi:MAG: dihydrofolate reductase [Pseudomonadota bacterium]
MRREAGKPRISIISAIAKNRTIGIDNTLPWRLSEDLKYFKALTLGHHILMGRKTWESIGKPLPGRTTVIITRSDYAAPEGVKIAHSLQEAIDVCGEDEEIFFVGGADLYGQALPLADRLYLTEIQADVEGDAWFPDYDRTQWREVSRDKRHDEASGLDYYFVVYDRQ